MEALGPLVVDVSERIRVAVGRRRDALQNCARVLVFPTRKRICVR
jgi:hypothetical protein